MKSMDEIKKCEYCSKEISIKYMVCPFCGGHLHEKEKLSSPTCPRCKVPLKLHLSNGEEYNICDKCGGFWLDRGGFHLLSRASKRHHRVHPMCSLRKADEQEEFCKDIRGDFR